MPTQIFTNYADYDYATQLTTSATKTLQAGLITESILTSGAENNIKVTYVGVTDGVVTNTGFVSWNYVQKPGIPLQTTITHQPVLGGTTSITWSLIFKDVSINSTTLQLVCTAPDEDFRIYFDVGYVAIPTTIYNNAQWNIDIGNYTYIPATIIPYGTTFWDSNSNDDIYNINVGGKVGINTGEDIDTSVVLDVNGNQLLRGDLEFETAGSHRVGLDSNSAQGYDFSIFNYYYQKTRLYIDNNGQIGINTNSPENMFHTVGSAQITERTSIGAGNDPLAKLHIKGEGSTSATCSLLVTNSQGLTLLKVCDDGSITLATDPSSENDSPWEVVDTDIVPKAINSGKQIDLGDVAFTVGTNKQWIKTIGLDSYYPENDPDRDTPLAPTVNWADNWQIVSAKAINSRIIALLGDSPEASPWYATDTQVLLQSDNTSKYVSLGSEGFGLGVNPTWVTSLGFQSAGSGTRGEVDWTDDRQLVSSKAINSRILALIQGGGDDLYLNDLLDVNASTPADGNVLTWDSATSKWIPLAVPGGGSDTLWAETASTVDLVPNKYVWLGNQGFRLGADTHVINAVGSVGGVATDWHDDHSVVTPLAIDNRILAQIDNIALSLNDLSDVRVPNPGDEEVLSWNGQEGAWGSRTIAEGVNTLYAMTDTAILNPASGQVLTWNGTKWANQDNVGSSTTLTKVVTTEAELNEAIEAINADNSYGGVIYVVGTIVITSSPNWDLSNITIEGLGDARISLSQGDASSYTYFLVLSAGNPIFRNIKISRKTTPTRNPNIIALEGAQSVTFDNVIFNNIVVPVSAGDPPHVYINTASSGGSMTFQNCQIYSDGVTSNYGGLSFKYNVASGSFKVYINDQKVTNEQSSNRYYFDNISTSATLQVITDGSVKYLSKETSTNNWNYLTDIDSQETISTPVDGDYLTLSRGGRPKKIAVQNLLDTVSNVNLPTGDLNTTGSLSVNRSVSTGVTLDVGGDLRLDTGVAVSNITSSTPTKTDTVSLITPSAIYPDIDKKEANSNGIRTWGSPGLEYVSSTQVRVYNGTGSIYPAYKDSLDFNAIGVSWNTNVLTFTSIPDLGIASIYVDQYGVIQKQYGDIAPAAKRDVVYLGYVTFDRGAVDQVYPAPSIVSSTATTVNDYIDFVNGSSKLSGSVINDFGSGRSIYITNGDLFKQGINYFNDVSNPNITTIPANGDDTTEGVFDFVKQDGNISGTSDQTVIPQSYDNAGTITALGVGEAAIQLFFQVPNGKTYMLYGDTAYADVATAEAALEIYKTSLVVPDSLADAIFLGSVIVNEADDTVSIKNRTGADGGGVIPNGALIDDGAAAADKVWSSSKVSTEILWDDNATDYVPKNTARGLAVGATDALGFKFYVDGTSKVTGDVELASGLTLSGLGTVTTADNEYLIFSGNELKRITGANLVTELGIDTPALGDLTDVTTEAVPAEGRVIVSAGAGGYDERYLNFDELGDTNVSGLADGDTVVYDNATGKWVNQAKIPASTTGDLTPVTGEIKAVNQLTFDAYGRVSGIGTTADLYTIFEPLVTAGTYDNFEKWYVTSGGGTFSVGSKQTLTILEGDNVTFDVDDLTRTITINAAGPDSNTYVDGVTFNTGGSGVLRLSRNDGAVLSVSLDSRYSLLGHNHDLDYDDYAAWNVNVDGDDLQIESLDTLTFTSGTNVQLDFVAGEITVNADHTHTIQELSNVTGPGTDGQVLTWSSGSVVPTTIQQDTYKVKLTSGDTEDYLANKLQQGTNITLATVGGKIVITNDLVIDDNIASTSKLYSSQHIDALVSAAAGGIKYYWNVVGDFTSQTGYHVGDLGVQVYNANRPVMRATANWSIGSDPNADFTLAYNMDAGTDLYLLKADAGAAGTFYAGNDTFAAVDYTDLANVPTEFEPVAHVHSAVSGYGAVSHGDLTGVSTFQHIDHSAVDIIAGSIMSGGGSIDNSVTINHAEIIALDPGNSGATVVQDLTFDGYGHITQIDSLDLNTYYAANPGDLPYLPLAGGTMSGAIILPDASNAASEDFVTDLFAALTINDLDDVVITGAADQELLTYDNGTGKWINQAFNPAGLGMVPDTRTIELTNGGGLTITPTPAGTDLSEDRVWEITHDSSLFSMAPLTGNDVISQISIDAYGHISSVATKSIVTPIVSDEGVGRIVTSTGSNSNLQAQGQLTYDGATGMSLTWKSSASGGGLNLIRKTNAVGGWPVSGEEVGLITMSGSQIKATAVGTQSTVSKGSTLSLLTTAQNDSLKENRLHIDQDGNITFNSALRPSVFSVKSSTSNTSVLKVDSGENTVSVNKDSSTATLSVGGSISAQITDVGGASGGTYIVTAKDFTIIADANIASNVRFPSPTNDQLGRIIYVKALSDNVDAVTTSGSLQDVNDGTNGFFSTAAMNSYRVTLGTTVMFQCDGRYWQIMTS